MNDRETILERALLVVVVGVIGIVAYVGCQQRPKFSSPQLPTPATNRAVAVEHVDAHVASSRMIGLAAAPQISLTATSTSIATIRVAAPYQGRGSMSLAWNASLTPGVTGYRLYFGQQSGIYTNSATVGNVLKATITGLEEGAQYYFACVAYDAAGVESANSNEATGVTGFYVAIRPANWSVEAFGRAGATNLFMRSTNLVDWVTIREFIGVSGVLTNVIEPNQVTAYYRVGVKP